MKAPEVEVTLPSLIEIIAGSVTSHFKPSKVKLSFSASNKLISPSPDVLIVEGLKKFAAETSPEILITPSLTETSPSDFDKHLMPLIVTVSVPPFACNLKEILPVAVRFKPPRF